MTGSRTLRRVFAAALAIAALGLTGASTTHVAADSNATTGDDNVTVPVQWWTFEGLTGQQALNLAVSRNARLTDISAQPGGGTFDGVMVSNTGTYASSWWMYTDVDSGTIFSNAATLNARFVRLISYSTPAGDRWAGILVPNSGPQFRQYGITYGQTSLPNGLGGLAGQGYRYTSVDAHVSGGIRFFTVLSILNSGDDANTWWNYTERSAVEIKADIAANNARLLQLQRNDNGTYNAVMVANTGADKYAWKYLLGLGSLAQLNAAAEQFGMRPIHIQRYATAAGTRYDVVMIDNVPAETRRLTSLVLPHVLNSAGTPVAGSGFSLRQVGGARVQSLNGDTPFDPATGIAALQNLAIMRQVQSGAVSLTTKINRFDYPHSPSPSWVPVTARCPVARDEIAAHAVPQTINTLHDAMMSTRDTRAIRAITRRIGVTSLRQLATSAGLTNTSFGQAFVGCGVTGGRNTTTLTDLTHLYEGVERGTLLTNTHGARAEFWQPMNGLIGTSALSAVVRQEATKLGKSSTVAAAFIARISMKSMLGQADVPCDDLVLSCNGTVTKTEFMNYAGKVAVPFKKSGALAPRTYVFADYLNGVNAAWTTSDSATQSFLATLVAETLRTTIRAALATW